MITLAEVHGTELIAFASAWIAPARAGAVRRLCEYAANVGYYGGTVAVLALRFYG